MTTLPELPKPKEIRRVDASDKILNEYFAKAEPVVIVNSSLVKSAAGKWSPDYLKEHIRKEARCTVFEAPNHNFRYWDIEKNTGEFDWPPPNSKLDLPYSEFLALIRGEKTRTPTKETKEEKEEKSGPHYYLQQKLTTNEATEQLLKDFSVFDWTKVLSIKLQNNWGPLTHNLLLVGEEGNCTPSHYDEQENVFCQLWGKKKIILHSPSDWKYLYTFPTSHTCDRQSQIDFDHIDRKRFPLYHLAQPLETTLSPGELLFIPSYWFHHMLAVTENVSVNFWFKAYNPPANEITFPLKSSQWVALTRNFEKFLGTIVGDRNIDDALIQLSKKEPQTEEKWKSLQSQVETLLVHVMKREEVTGFLREITEGRYGVLSKLPRSSITSPLSSLSLAGEATPQAPQTGKTSVKIEKGEDKNVKENGVKEKDQVEREMKVKQQTETGKETTSQDSAKSSSQPPSKPKRKGNKKKKKAKAKNK